MANESARPNRRLTEPSAMSAALGLFDMGERRPRLVCVALAATYEWGWRVF